MSGRTGDRVLATGLTLLACASLAVAVHLASILILPRVAPADAFSRIAAPLPVGALRLLPPSDAPDSPVPFRDPLLASAVCRYDLRQGPLRVIVPVSGDAFVAMSFHGRTGTVFYGLTGSSANDGRIDVVLMTAEQAETAEAADNDDQPTQRLRVTTAEREGFVQFDALARLGGLPVAERSLRSMSCEIQRDL